MSYGLDQLLSFVALGKPIEMVKNGIPDPLPEFSAVKGTPALGDVKRFMTYRGTRQTSRRVEYNAPSLRAVHTPVGEKDVKCLTSKENLPIDGAMLLKMRSMDSYVADMGKDWLAITTRIFTTRFDNLRKAQRWMMLATGTTYFNAAGDLLPSSSGALAVGAGSIDIGVSANHKNQANGIIDLPWSDPQANIPFHITKLQQQAAFETGFDLEVALYGAKIPGFISQNDFCLDYLARNPSFNEAFTRRGADGQGILPDGLFGIKRWIPTHKVFFDTADANNVLTHNQIFADDSFVLTPLPNADWYEQVEGTTLVPTTFNATADMAEAIATGKRAVGMWGYGLPTHDPFGATLFYGDVFLAFIKNADVLWQLDVDF